jgi:hypothetical protein
VFGWAVEDDVLVAALDEGTWAGFVGVDTGIIGRDEIRLGI